MASCDITTDVSSIKSEGYFREMDLLILCPGSSYFAAVASELAASLWLVGAHINRLWVCSKNAPPYFTE